MKNEMCGGTGCHEAGNEAEARIAELLQIMTLEEKAGQMSQYLYLKEDAGTLKCLLKEGKIGSFYGMADDIEIVNEMHRIAVEESRLGIPVISSLDALHGFRTKLPIPLGEASSWDTDLVERCGALLGREIHYAGFHWVYAPMVDIARDPRWGRIAEGYGEDPYLGSAMAAAKVKGLQKNDWEEKPGLMACVKHFAAYGGAEGGRDYNTVEVSENTLRGIYLPPYKAAIDAGVETVMNSFNDLNGIPVTANCFLLRDILRKEWGFEGIIVSDYRSINELVSHGIAADLKEAARLAVIAGVDVDLHGDVYNQYLPELVREGTIPEQLLNESVARILRAKFKLGLFQQPYYAAGLSQRLQLTQGGLGTALEAARKSIVLLKNHEMLLPLKKNCGRIAVIGPLADDTKNVLGCWAWQDHPDAVVSVLEGIKASVGPEVRVKYSKGCEIDGTADRGIAEAVELAANSDVAVVVVGESQLMNGEGFCRSSLDLPGVQQELVEAVHATGVPVIAVLVNGRPLAVSWMNENIPAILEAWAPGIQTGRAVADIIFGDFTPCGKLPVTFPRAVGQLPVYYNHKSTGRPPDPDSALSLAPNTQCSRYMDLPVTPLYPFGYGLSYTRFEYTRLQLSAEKIKIGDTLLVSAEIKNAGEREGDEVVQLYIRDIAASMTRPVKELKGFRRITLRPGEIRKVKFQLTVEELGFFNREMEFVVEPGKFKVWVGTNSEECLEKEFEVTG